MDWLLASIHAHPTLWGMGSLLFAVNGINAMPTPRANSGMFYMWVFGTLQGIGGGMARLLAVYKPDLLTKITGQQVQTPAPATPPQP